MIDVVYSRLFGNDDCCGGAAAAVVVVVKFRCKYGCAHNHPIHYVSSGKEYEYGWDLRRLLNSSSRPQRQIQHHDQSRLIMMPILGGRYSSQLP